MKSILNSIAAGSLLAVLAIAQPSPRYKVTDLGPVGGSPGSPNFITNNGLVGGAAASANGSMHLALWYKGVKLNIGTPGLGGPNSAGFGVNERGQAVGPAQTSVPNAEDFCGFNAYGLPSSSTACLPFLWQNGVMTKLPTLGGANGVANSINNRGQVVGYAENTMKDADPACPVSQFKPVTWVNGAIHELHTYAGDPDGVAAAINDNGQVVGASGTCSTFNPNSGLHLVENHALLWEKDGTVHDLGNLGGTGGIAGNHACAINNEGQVVGHSELSHNSTFHGFLWTRETGMRDLGTLAGDFASLALGINDRGNVVGGSLDPSFSPRASLWQNGKITDLNTLIPTGSSLFLLLALSINSSGEIVGLAFHPSTGDLHGFLATPRNGEHGGDTESDHGSDSAAPDAQDATSPMVLHENARNLLQQLLPFGRFGARLMEAR
jgi:probable HAF family extracellular repeat protein